MNECIIYEEVVKNTLDKPTESFETLLEKTWERNI